MHPTEIKLIKLSGALLSHLKKVKNGNEADAKEAKEAALQTLVSHFACRLSFS